MVGIPIVRSSFPEFVVQFERCLAQLDALAIPWRNTRFDQYRKALQEAAAAVYPRTVNLRDPKERERDRLLREAAIQSEQLMVSSEIWAAQPEALLKSKLKLIVSGRALPPSGTKDQDASRNTLAELATAALLQRRGFSVMLTESDEDILATVPELQPFAIECKRPASEAAIERNVHDMRRQFRERCKKKDKYGFAVLAVDRLRQVSGGMLTVNNESSLRIALDRELRSILGKVQELISNPLRPQLHLYPTVRLVGCLFVGTIFLQERGMPVTVGLLAAASAAPSYAREASFVIDIVQRYMPK